MYKAIKENKIIAISEKKEIIIHTEDGDMIQEMTGEALFPCLVYDEVVEDNQHEVADFVMIESEFVLKDDEKAIEQQKEQVREVRNGYLQETDIYMIADFPITEEERNQYKAYRQYLRDYTTGEDWWEENPMDFNTWKQGQTVLMAEE